MENELPPVIGIFLLGLTFSVFSLKMSAAAVAQVARRYAPKGARSWPRALPALNVSVFRGCAVIFGEMLLLCLLEAHIMMRAQNLLATSSRMQNKKDL